MQGLVAPDALLCFAQCLQPIPISLTHPQFLLSSHPPACLIPPGSFHVAAKRRTGCATWKLELGGDGRLTALPVILEASIEVAAPLGEDGIGSADSQEHTRPFETGSDDGFASGFNDAGAHKEVLTAELRVAHAVLVPKYSASVRSFRRTSGFLDLTERNASTSFSIFPLAKRRF